MIDRQWKIGDEIDIPVDIQGKIKNLSIRINEIKKIADAEVSKTMQEVYNLLAIHIPEINKEYICRVNPETMKIIVDGYEEDQGTEKIDTSQTLQDIENLQKSLNKLC